MPLPADLVRRVAQKEPGHRGDQPAGVAATRRGAFEATTFLLQNRSINGVNLNIYGGDVLI